MTVVEKCVEVLDSRSMTQAIDANSSISIYERGWWMRCDKDYILMISSWDMDPSDQQTHYLSIVGSDQAGEGHGEDDEDYAEEKHELFRNISSNPVCADYCTCTKGDNR